MLYKMLVITIVFMYSPTPLPPPMPELSIAPTGERKNFSPYPKDKQVRIENWITQFYGSRGWPQEILV